MNAQRSWDYVESDKYYLYSLFMVDKFILGVVDQSPVREGGSGPEALEESVKLAQFAERLGFHRYWVAEHHNTGGYAGTSPEILMGQIASKTKTIIVGSGGVMLSHYSAFKVAETFNVLRSFYPDRIELGIGRAPGSDQLTARALAYPRPMTDINEFPQQVTDLIGYLSNTLPEEHVFSGVRSQPIGPEQSMPGIWLLGSSDYSARLAAMLGLPFSFADFFGTTAEHGPLIAELYRQNFRPSGYLDAPRFNVALQVICADTNERAQYIASSRDVSRINSLKGIRGPLISPETASLVAFSDLERQHLDNVNKYLIQGTPDVVKARIQEAANIYRTDDISVATNCYHFSDRVRSFQLIAEAFGLSDGSVFI